MQHFYDANAVGAILSVAILASKHFSFFFAPSKNFNRSLHHFFLLFAMMNSEKRN